MADNTVATTEAPVAETPTETPATIASTTAPTAAATPSSTKPKLTVHHLNNSRSQRILWLLEELEVPYEIKEYKRGSDLLAPKEMKAVHPLGKAPIITDGDVTLAESGAIIEYIINTYGGEKSQPPAAGKIDNLYFTHYAEGSFVPLLVNKLTFQIVPKRAPMLLRPIASMLFAGITKQMLEPRIKEHAVFIEAHLAKTPSGWFAGGDHPTSADYQMMFPLEALAARAPETLGPKMKEYVEKIQARPAYKRAVEKGGAYGVNA